MHEKRSLHTRLIFSLASWIEPPDATLTIREVRLTSNSKSRVFMESCGSQDQGPLRFSMQATMREALSELQCT